MNDQWLWVAVSVAEVLFVLVLVLLVAWLRNTAARRRDRRAIHSLVADTKAAKMQRVAEIREFLRSRFGLSGDQLTVMVRALYKGEARLIQAFANIYLERDARAAANFRRPVEEGLSPYWNLGEEVDVPVTGQAGADDEAATTGKDSDAAEAEEHEDNAAEVARLRGENDRLSEELKVTMDTMSRMLNEYSTVFAKDGDIGRITVVDEEPADPEGVSDEPAAQDVAAMDAKPVGETEDGAGPDDILAAAMTTDEAGGDESQPSAEPGEGESADDETDIDPDAILAAAASEPGEPGPGLDDGDRFLAELDSEMKDLSLDDEADLATDADTASEGQGGADTVADTRAEADEAAADSGQEKPDKAAAERQRVIDADS